MVSASCQSDHKKFFVAFCEILCPSLTVFHKSRQLKSGDRPWSLKFYYRNAPIRGLALSKQNICEISHKKLCDSSIMIEKASNYTMNALKKSSELWHSSSSRKARPRIGAFLYKNFSDHGYYFLSREKWISNCCTIVFKIPCGSVKSVKVCLLCGLWGSDSVNTIVLAQSYLGAVHAKGQG